MVLALFAARHGTGVAGLLLAGTLLVGYQLDRNSITKS